MKNKKILALVLAVALMVTQFAMLSSVNVSAVAALSGRSDFITGVSVHPTPGYDTYKRPYNVVLDAASLGSKVVRTGTVSTQYDQIFADMAYKNGMQVMFVMDLTSFKDGNSFKTPAQIGDAGYTAIYNKFYAQAELLKDYDGYIQMGNELDAVMKSSNFGTYGGKNTSNYGNVDALAVAVYAAHKGVQDANTANGSNVKTVFNFAFNHYGLLTKVKNVNIDPTLWSFTSETGTVHATWDYIGLNYYSNMYDDEVYSTILSELDSNFTQKVIITESNLTPTSKSGSTIYYAQNVSWLENFVRACYADSNVAGFIAYELYDESEREGNSFNREAYFGLINKDGNKKGSFTRLCELYGGDTSIPLAKNRSVITAAPAKSEYAEIDILEGVVSSEWHPYYSNTKDNLYVDLNDTPVNLSEVSCFEFDIFIEDYASFAAAVAGKRINFVLSSDASKSDSTHRARYDFASQVTKNGWNHITLDKGNYWSKDSSFTYNSVKWAMIVFQDGGSAPNPIAGQKVAIANVVASPAEIDRVPATPDNFVQAISMEGKRTDWGASTFADVNNKVYVDLESSVNTKVAQFIEFDIYIADQAAFHSAFDSHAPRFYESSADNKNNNRRVFNFADQITKDGWNHIALNRDCRVSSDSTAQESIKHVGLACFSNTGDSNPLKNVPVRIANICSTDAPAYPDYAVEGTAICTRLRNYENGSDGNKTGMTTYQAFDDKKEASLPARDWSSRLDFSTCDQIELDFWCASYPAFASNISGHTFYLVIMTKGNNTNYRARYAIGDQITKNGWNHIVVNKSANTSGQTPDFTQVSGFYFSFWGVTGNLPSQANPVFATNVCGTMSEINRPPVYPDYPTLPIHAAGRDYNPSSNRIAKYHYFADKP
ncbi:MAG: hypothetical protein J5766_04545, partial [Clostridia bacterium]|nr:hypothetical protein [Clostridia bacterium]